MSEASMKLTEEEKEFCTEHGLTKKQFFGKKYIEHNLSVNTLPKRFKPWVANLYVYNGTIVPQGFSAVVTEHLNMRSVGGHLPSNVKLFVGGLLELDSITSIGDGVKLYCGGEIWTDTTKEVEDDLKVVCNWLHFDRMQESRLRELKGVNPLNVWVSSADGSLNDIRQYNPETLNRFSYDGRDYVLADGMITEVISSKGDMVFKCKTLEGDPIYLVCAEGKTAHGDSIKKAKEDLIFKLSTRDKSSYKDYTLDTVVSLSEAIGMYRSITGACEEGTRRFVKNNLKETKDQYSVDEIIEITQGAYGHESFREFFA